MRSSLFLGIVTFALGCLMFLGTEWYYLRMQLYGGWSSASGDPLTVLPALGLVFLIVSVALFLNASGRFKFPAPLPRATILLVSLAILATVSTGWVLTGEFITPAASWWDDYGFPLAWRVVSMNGCPPWCNLPRSTTIFNPFFFAIDFCFFMAIGYGVTSYSQKNRSPARSEPWCTVRRSPISGRSQTDGY